MRGRKQAVRANQRMSMRIDLGESEREESEPVRQNEIDCAGASTPFTERFAIE